MFATLCARPTTPTLSRGHQLARHSLAPSGRIAGAGTGVLLPPWTAALVQYDTIDDVVPRQAICIRLKMCSLFTHR